ncbi:MAG TPA: 1-acyl-sn-glycerol-3-phosphate acyltransferase [Candidatus Limnocylindria bacterium]|nr:1-acyl-sn-glycerol-3-phosphate acyltransferase [Candidatus Limnocylindria bacterium]
MLTRFGALGRLLVALAFRHVQVLPDSVEHVRRLAEQHTIVYVMRYRSLIDYLLVNAVLLREGLPLARFAPGVSMVLWWPLGEILRWFAGGRRRPRRPAPARCGSLVAAGEPVLLFMRSQTVAGRRRRALQAARIGTRFLRDVMRAAHEAPRAPVLIPVAIFRGPGFRRRESRFATLVYSVQEAPGEARRLLNYLWNAEHLRLTLGREIPLRRFIEAHRDEPEERTVRRLARTLQIDLYREERLVLGPALLPRRMVREQVLRDPDVARLTRKLALERRVPREKVMKQARAYVDEMAANFNGLYFGVLEFLFNRIWPRVFSGLEVRGLERVAECMKEHPVVLVPCHRSHFDYLILTYIFHTNYLSPPHIAAGINLSFWPMGPLFRGAGAFFIRRTFADNELYKMIFRKYLTFLIREGYTQEFFIEGGRTRTGKMLTPKLGMLSAIVDAFVQGVRRDLYLVPVSIHYGRIPEEEAYRREVAGEEKQRESLVALLRARSVLSRRYGTAYVNYGEPISLADALGSQRERFHEAAGDPAVERERQRFVQRLGFRLLREVNAVAVVGATSVSATVLLGGPRAAMPLAEFLTMTAALLTILREAGAELTASLLRNERSGFRESLNWLESGGVAERLRDGTQTVLHVPAEKRQNLDYYKNNIIHFLLLPALVRQGLAHGARDAALEAYVARWLDVYRWEFPLPERETLAGQVARWQDFYARQGALVDGQLVPSHVLVRVTAGVLENFREAYLTAARTIATESRWPVPRRALLEAMRRQYRVSLLLGELTKPEGNSVVTFGNALSRFAELGFIRLGEAPQGRERWIERGPSYDGLATFIDELRGVPGP